MYPITVTLANPLTDLRTPHVIDVENELLEQFVAAFQAVDPTLSRYHIRGAACGTLKSFKKNLPASITVVISHDSAALMSKWGEVPLEFTLGYLEGLQTSL